MDGRRRRILVPTSLTPGQVSFFLLRCLFCKNPKRGGGYRILIRRVTTLGNRTMIEARCAHCGARVRRLQNNYYYQELLAGSGGEVIVENVPYVDVHYRYATDERFKSIVDTLAGLCEGYTPYEIRDVARCCSFKRGFWRISGKDANERMKLIYGEVIRRSWVKAPIYEPPAEEEESSDDEP